jgi:hypothetical protein
LLKARRERAAKTDQRGLPQRVVQSGSGDESSDDGGGGEVATNEPSDGTVDLGSNTQGGNGGGGTKKVKGKKRGKRKKGGDRKKGRGEMGKKRRLDNDDGSEHH